VKTPVNSMKNNHHYNKKLKDFARELRNGSTQAEKHLWYNLLSKKQMDGYRFLRQRTINNYIADFACLELSLIVEVDETTHDYQETQIHDAKRQKELEALGFRVVRVTDWEVQNDMTLVYEIIKEDIDKIVKEE